MELSRVIIGPIVSEKAYRQQDAGKYTVKIHPSATKIEVQHAFKAFFGLAPKSVNIAMVRPKSRTVGRGRVFTKRGCMRKAIVTLEKGTKVDFGKLTVKSK